MRARARERAGDVEGAKRDREEGLRRRPADEMSWIARGLARLENEQATPAELQQALADFEQALALNPRSRDALQNKLHVLSERLNLTQEALAVADRLVQVYPDYARGRIGRGVLYARLGRREEAHADAREALARNSQPITRFQAGCIYALTSRQAPGDRGPALKFLKEALNQGFGAELLAKDPDLDPLRSLPEFKNLVAAAAVLRR
jgi:tetratricopeptide (TPR) repeat protein